MSIGPVFDCSLELTGRLADIFAAERVQVRSLGESSSIGDAALTFSKGVMARIVAHAQFRDGRVLLWLVFPKAHAFNPMFWYFDGSLSKRIERTLEKNGAVRVNWREWAAATESHKD